MERKKTDTPELRHAASVKALAARWGNRGTSRTVRVDVDAAQALQSVPERDRRQVASDAVREAVSRYKARISPS